MLNIMVIIKTTVLMSNVIALYLLFYLLLIIQYILYFCHMIKSEEVNNYYYNFVLYFLLCIFVFLSYRGNEVNSNSNTYKLHTELIRYSKISLIYSHINSALKHHLNLFLMINVVSQFHTCGAGKRDKYTFYSNNS